MTLYSRRKLLATGAAGGPRRRGGRPSGDAEDYAAAAMSDLDPRDAAEVKINPYASQGLSSDQGNLRTLRRSVLEVPGRHTNAPERTSSAPPG